MDKDVLRINLGTREPNSRLTQVQRSIWKLVQIIMGKGSVRCQCHDPFVAVSFERTEDTSPQFTGVSACCMWNLAMANDRLLVPARVKADLDGEYHDNYAASATN